MLISKFLFTGVVISNIVESYFYNENTIGEKKEIIRQTSEYINDRISQLDRYLGAKESQIASFKRENQILNLNDYGKSYLNQSIETQEEMQRQSSGSH